MSPSVNPRKNIALLSTVTAVPADAELNMDDKS